MRREGSSFNGNKETIQPTLIMMCISSDHSLPSLSSLSLSPSVLSCSVSLFFAARGFQFLFLSFSLRF